MAFRFGNLNTGPPTGWPTPAPNTGAWSGPLLPETLQNVLESLDESRPSYALVHYFYNYVGDSGAAAPPPPPPPPSPLLQALWQEAVQQNPDPQRLSVTRVAGFSALYERAQQQRERLRAYAAALSQVEQRLQRAQTLFEQRVAAKVDQVYRADAALQHKLLDVMGLLESTLSVVGTPARSASLATARHGVVVRQDAAEAAHLRQRLEALRKRMDAARDSNMKERCERSWRQARYQHQRARHPHGRTPSAESAPIPVADTASALRDALEYQRQGIETLMRMMQNDSADMARMQATLLSLRAPASQHPVR
ncbi:hypothetical protein CDCA_CDCA07G2128 [Cyanidium caldarium]|uniref:Nucleoporin Nup54 alpha-helical domain-containing protein n=1 Tax=Cyanidium caldarium TaxID=2771 RepID=A0AAV9IWC0_CYACA|nr:hypothetical protein CDCA_CDCA07G2128 [Cyanidium caldarium]|eukprot:ctg_1304.g412